MNVLRKLQAGALALALGTVLPATPILLAPQAANAAGSYIKLTASDLSRDRQIHLGVDKSIVVDLPRPASDVLVSNPAIADAVLRTSRRLYLIGVKTGQANVFLFDSSGAQIGGFDINVDVDLTSLNEILRQAIPDGTVRADTLNGNFIIRGQVKSASDSAKAQQIVAGMMQGFNIGTVDSGASGGGAAAGGAKSGGASQAGSGGGASQSSSSEGAQSGQSRIINLLTITGEEQVSLRVTIAEIQRTVVKQLGVNLGNGSADALTSGNFSANSGSGTGLSPLTFPINTATSPGTLNLSWSAGGNSISATVKALEETNMIRTLAEPTLTAVSGETANFVAGGEFPIVTGVSDTTGTPTVTFKDFGVKLAFTPTVLGPGRISLHVRTEVSEINSAYSITTSGYTIPGLNTRNAESTVELPSGGAFVLAGLMNQQTQRAATGLPVLQKLPILGALFSSKDFQNAQTELVMIVTPYLVKPVSPQQLARPGDNYVGPTDSQAYFMNRLNRVYGAAPAAATSRAGKVGFSFD
ncbi:pilus assembly protein CpaC [Faunimonas pinastri]|uniref:Pilus assembly protein CpaC n=1 Tax=Faunimonas pinastri TaxID=1855383 RepID=A0A1H9HHV9_9HYPH|nr:type II and III secretion system protein family protein [Faunimonas pinastri]SEQ61884.1 pilus assembly protein CpaC [Faunimonas pinastri]